MATAKLGNYVIDFLNEIGRGAFGTVYMATDAEGKKVAVKRIGRNGKAKTTHSKDLEHPNIVRIFEVIEHKSAVFMFMEFCPHGDLRSFFFRQKLSEQQKLHVTIQIAEGVEYLHKNDIVHRDIKPSNILIHSDIPLLAKLGDFGLSRALEEYEPSTMSSNVGTASFKAPEFFMQNGQRKIGYHRNVDIWALGLTFLALIQENRGLVPQIETPLDDSELYAPIGQLIAERIKYSVKPLAVVAEDATIDSLDVENITVDHTKEVRRLVQGMTHHIPQRRCRATEVIKLLCIIVEVPILDVKAKLFHI